MQEAREEPETAKGEVDERVGAAETFLHPHTYGRELCHVLVRKTVGRGELLEPAAVGARTYQDAEKHQEAVGATHDGGIVR
jgi:hypothetical protein